MSKTVLIIRRKDEFSRILAADGFEIVNLPLIETKPLADLSDFREKLARIENYDGIFITSQNAARILADEMREKKIGFSGKIYVLGGKSFEILKDENLDLFFDMTANTAGEFLSAIPPENLSGKNFLFVRGEKSLRVVPDFLTKIASVDETVVYETVEKAVETEKINELREKFENKEIAAVCFFSPSAGESFIKQFGAEILHQTVIAAIGKTTAEFFEQRDLPVDFISSKSNAETFAAELIEYLERG